MQIIADLQIHSKYSRAVSPSMTLPEIARWSKLKGIDLVATGDWTHPLWIRSIKSELKESASGIYSLKDSGANSTRFLLSTEISSIYSQGGQARRVHNLIFSPSIATCDKIIRELNNHGCKLMSDGRPIVGISSAELLKMVLTIDERALFIPAHAWTPWFSVFGSKSGFSSLSECFGDYSKYIYAIETGLSSDPAMNWKIRELENRSLVSFSDAHSGPKLGREATVFVPNTISNFEIRDSKFSYDDIAKAIKQEETGKLKIGYTIEFFPEEGKYHWSGHRACNVRYNALDIINKGKICPVCKKTLTVGVENRVLDLSDKALAEEHTIEVKNDVGLTFVYDREKKRKPFVSVVPLLEVLLELNGRSPTKAAHEYEIITSKISEFEFLLRKSYDELENIGGNSLRQAIQRVRERQVYVDPGYDGLFGKVQIFDKDNEKAKKKEIQQSLF